MYNNLNPITHLPTLIKKQQQYTADIKRIDNLLLSREYNWFTANDIKNMEIERTRIERELYKIECLIKNRS